MSARSATIRRPWSIEEDEALATAVIALRKTGVAISWTTIADVIGGRTGKQCRERWQNHLDPSINKEPFTEQELDVIHNAQRTWGENQWAKIAHLLPGRTDNMVKNRWYSSLRQTQRRAAKHPMNETVANRRDSTGGPVIKRPKLADPTAGPVGPGGQPCTPPESAATTHHQMLAAVAATAAAAMASGATGESATESSVWNATPAGHGVSTASSGLVAAVPADGGGKESGKANRDGKGAAHEGEKDGGGGGGEAGGGRGSNDSPQREDVLHLLSAAQALAGILLAGTLGPAEYREPELAAKVQHEPEMTTGAVQTV